MTLETRKRSRLTPREAQLMLDNLARCKSLRPEGVDENTIICTHDEIRIVWEGGPAGHFVHSTDHIADLRDIADEGRWP